MTTAVLDANVLASGLISKDAPAGAVLRAWQAGAFSLVTSEHLIAETARTLRKPYFVSRVSQQRAARLLALLRYRSHLTPITITVSGIATHPEDDLVLATAVSAQSDYLVSGDEKLQQVGSYHDVTIVSPRAFLALLGER